MANHTKDAVFRFHIDNEGETSYAEHKHPVPTFLCQPSPFQQASQQFYEAYINVISVITAQHHDECMSKVSSACAGCRGPATDALKSPINLLHLVEPTMIIQVIPVCGRQACESQVRKQIIDKQNSGATAMKEAEKDVFMKLPCDTCKAPDSKRCAGCGQVAYCSTECQKEAWKTHKPNCMRRNLKTPCPNANLPYEVI